MKLDCLDLRLIDNALCYVLENCCHSDFCKTMISDTLLKVRVIEGDK